MYQSVVSKAVRATSIMEDVLTEGEYATTFVAEVASACLVAGIEDAETVRQLSLGIIAELLLRGWAVAGDFSGDGQFVEWSSSPSESLARIASEWLHEWPDAAPDPYEIAWLDLTDSGRTIAAAVRARLATVD